MSFSRTITQLSVLSVVTVLSISAFGAVLFEDDFEADAIGKEPAKWNPVAGLTLSVEKDPAGGNNQVLDQKGEANGKGAVTPVDWDKQDFWTDYVWEFDWMWNGDGYS